MFRLFQNGGYAYLPSLKVNSPKTSLVFALKEELGTLHEALKVFKVCGFSSLLSSHQSHDFNMLANVYSNIGTCLPVYCVIYMVHSLMCVRYLPVIRLVHFVIYFLP